MVVSDVNMRLFLPWDADDWKRRFGVVGIPEGEYAQVEIAIKVIPGTQRKMQIK
jgi:hypothetical protein